MALNPKQQRFVQEYLTDMNATQAAIRAGYSAKTARQVGSRLLSHADISAAVQKKAAKQIERAELTVERIVDGLLTEATRVDEGSTHGARVAAWGVLAKYKGMATEKVEVGNLDGNPFKVDAAIELRAVYPKK